MSLFANAIQRGARADQPAASAVVVGALYFVTDEGVTERSTGSAWESFTDGDNTALGDITDLISTDAEDSEGRISDRVMVGTGLTLTEIADGSGDAISLAVDDTTVVLETDTNYVDLTDGGESTLHTHPLAFTDQSLEDGRIHGAHPWEEILEQPFLYKQVILPCREVTATADVTLTTDDATYQFIDGNGSNRNVDLPSEFTGLCFLISNISDTETITVRDNAAATVATLAAGEFKTFIYSGSAWRAM